MMGVANSHVNNTLHNITDENRFIFDVPVYYQQEPVDISQINFVLIKIHLNLNYQREMI